MSDRRSRRADELEREARRSITARARFEENHWKSDKPLTPVVVDPHELLDALAEVKARAKAEELREAADTLRSLEAGKEWKHGKSWVEAHDRCADVLETRADWIEGATDE